MKDKIWITWEDHRRSRELAKAFSAEYVCLTHPGKRPVRYTILSIKTILNLIKKKPEVVFCQNPSIILNSLLCFLKPFFKYKIISDRHSNFKFHTLSSKKIKWRVFQFLSHYSLKRSEVTIVTNAYLQNYVNTHGGNAFVLPDKLPTFNVGEPKKLKGERNFVFVSTFSPDEPIDALIEAARMLDEGSHIYITGNYKKHKNTNQLLATLPKNVTLTGFISEDDYVDLISSADILIVITDEEYTLTCGAYEAVSLGKPMVLGNTLTIRNYFSAGAIYSSYDALALNSSMLTALRDFKRLEVEVAGLRHQLDADWHRKFEILLDIIKIQR